MKNIYFKALLVFTLCCSLNLVQAQQALSVRTGATFQWAAPQPTPSDPTVLTSITVNGLVYDQLVVPDGYEMTQLGPNGHAANAVRTNGTVTVSNSSNPTWDADALAAFQNFNLNQYFQSSLNGRNICGDSVAYSTTDAQKQSLLYDIGILSTPGAMVAVVERNANNCFYVELFGTPAGGGPDQILGGTFVRNNSAQWGTTIAPPTNNTDYWNSGRTNDNTQGGTGFGSTIGIALFQLSDIAPINSIVRKVTLTASTVDHGDGKFFIAALRADLGIIKTIDNPTPVVGSNITFSLVASNANTAGLYADTAVTVEDLLPSGFTYVSHSTTQGTYTPLDGRWEVGTLQPGDTDTLHIVATVNPSGTYINSARIAGGLFDEDLTNNQDTAIAYPITPDPDFNVTFVNVPVPGDVSTNDENFPVGTTYGAPTAVPGNPDGSMPTMNSDGTYTFVSPVPGVFEFMVPVCAPGVVMPNCQETLLTITVLDESINNPPVANTDITSTQVNTPVTLGTLDNDEAGNITDSLVPSTVNVVDSPKNGTASVDPVTGDITYTPNEGFIGTDTLEYEVCDNQTPAQCATAVQIITVKGTDAPNTTAAADDYAYTPKNTAVSGSVKENDTDPEGHNQTVTAQTTTIPGKGTLTLATDGSYTFLPAPGYTGPVEFPYTTCDDGTPQACAMATLHILVSDIVVFPLHIDNVEFYGQISNGTNIINWNTINEVRIDYFELYHGKEIASITKLATIPSKGDGNNSYSYIHANPIEGSNNYYQLRSVDFEQTGKYHDVINLYIGKKGNVILYPSPATDKIKISVNGWEVEDLKVELFDLTGKIIQSNMYQIDNSSFAQEVSVQDLASGIYILKMNDMKGQQHTFKVEKR